MKNFEITLDNAVFTYFLYKEKHSELSNNIFIQQHNLWLSYSKKTEVIEYSNNENSIYIIGLCIDSYAEIERADIPQFLLSNEEINIIDIINKSKRFAGNYVIIVSLAGNLFAFTDATACMQINYFEKEICLASFEHTIAQKLNIEYDERNLKIREGADFVAAMPNDITIYKNIKTLLPNHYLNLNCFEATRFYPNIKLEHFKNSDEVLQKHIFLIDNIVKEYSKHIELVCPLTSGWDSRVVFLFLTKNLDNIEAYTFFHSNFNNNTPDIVIPQKICKKRNVNYFQLPDLLPDSDFFDNVCSIIGSHFYKEDISMAYTYLCEFEKRATINGNIIDQLGKSSLVNLLPVFCASSSYFTAKKRNVNCMAKNEVCKWISQIKSSKIYGPYVYDLFGLEDQCGRWCEYSQKIYAATGITLLNIFNSREIIEDWVRVSHKDRMNHKIHFYFFNKVAKDLLEFPFNPDEKFKFVGKSKILFFIATYVRHFLRIIKKPHLTKNKGK